MQTAADVTVEEHQDENSNKQNETKWHDTYKYPVWVWYCLPDFHVEVGPEEDPDWLAYEVNVEYAVNGEQA